MILARDLLSDTLPKLRTSDTGSQALSLMEVFRVSHLPIVNHQEFLGLLSDTDVYNLNNPEAAIGNHSLSLFSPYVYEDQHIFEVIELVSRLKLTLVPVLEKNQEFLGSISLLDLVSSFSEISQANHPGAIIILQLHVHDYSLSQMARIVETNDAKIMSVFLNSPADSMRMEVTLKLNVSDISSIVQTFERFNYTIISSFREENKMDHLLQDRYEEFMRYLNV